VTAVCSVSGGRAYVDGKVVAYDTNTIPAVSVSIDEEESECTGNINTIL